MLKNLYHSVDQHSVAFVAASIAIRDPNISEYRINTLPPAATVPTRMTIPALSFIISGQADIFQATVLPKEVNSKEPLDGSILVF